MKTISLILIMLIASTSAFSKDLICDIKVNLDSVLTVPVSTTLKDKVMIGEVDEARAYITEQADNQFLVEAYLPDYEIRIYGLGTLREAKDTVTASLWGREYMIDIACSLNSKKK